MIRRIPPARAARQLAAVIVLVAAVPSPGGATASARLEVVLDATRLQVERISDVALGVIWKAARTPLLEGAGLDRESIRPRVTVERLSDSEVAVSAVLSNEGREPARVAPAFPCLAGLAVNGRGDGLRHCFPARPAVIGERPGRQEAWYSGSFPMQFLSIHQPGLGGMYVRIEDTTNQPKLFVLDRDETVDIRVEYPARMLGAGESWTLPRVVIGCHSGDWHAAFLAYRGWLRSWFRPTAPRKDWLQGSFSFRTQFLHFDQPQPSGMFDPSTRRLAIPEVVDRDRAAFGGLDYLHLFDWAWTPEHGRVGDYRPWDHIGGLESFRRQLAAVRAEGVRVGLYTEGYLVSIESGLGQREGVDWEMHDSAGQPVRRWGDYHHLCPHVAGWQEHLAETCLRLVEETGVDGVYVDQCGFANQYVCHRADHGHPVPSGNLTGEAALLRSVRARLPDQVALLIEEAPTDVMQQWVDGSFTAAVAQGIGREPECLLNLARFAIPDFKSFELISEQGLQDNLEAVRVSFFNGQGLYLAGVAEAWYSPECRALIAKTHGLLRRHRWAFLGSEPVPLVPTLHERLMANHFPADDFPTHGEVWALFNTGSEPLEGELLAVPHQSGAVYEDLWSGEPVGVRTLAGQDHLRFRVGGREAGCIWRRSPRVRSSSESDLSE